MLTVHVLPFEARAWMFCLEQERKKKTTLAQK